jgi:short-subunit dehydrogenase
MTTLRAMITGASQGIGREFATQLAANGHDLTLVSRNEPLLKELIEELKEGSHTPLPLDLSRTEGIDSLAGELASKHYDLLVNNAGVGLFGPFHQTNLAKARGMIRLNCEAMVVLSHAFLQSAQKGDALINVSGLLGVIPFPGMAEYAATKAFVMSFCESLWYEEKNRGVYVMGLCPGPTTTNFIVNAGGTDSVVPPKSFIQTPTEVVSRALAELKKRERSTVFACNMAARVGFGFLRTIPRKALFSRLSSV